MKENSKKTSVWKEIFVFTSDGKLKSLQLMYSFALGLCILFVNFFISNLVTISFEKWFRGLARTWLNAIDVLVPSLICAALFVGLFCLLKNKRIVPIAYYIDLLLISIGLVILLVQLSKDTFAVLFPAFLCIFIIPVFIGALAITITYYKWNQKHTDEF